MDEMAFDLRFACASQIAALDRKSIKRIGAEQHLMRTKNFPVLERKRVERAAEFVFGKQQRRRDVMAGPIMRPCPPTPPGRRSSGL
jgi:hypothetical protein